MNFKSLKPMQLIIAPFHRLGQALGDFLSQFIHKHRWIEVQTNVIAEFSKRDSDDDRIELRGSVFRCHCDEYMFFPEDKDLYPVEVDTPIP